LVLFAMLLMTVGQILFRSVLEISASWSEELIQYSFAFIVFIGAIGITQDESHITITAGLDIAPSSLKRAMRIVGRLVVIPLMVLFTFGAFQNAQNNWDTSLPTADWMKIGYMYGVMTLSGFLMTFHLLWNIIKDLRGKIDSIHQTGDTL